MTKKQPKTLEEWHAQFRKEADDAMRVSPKTRKMVEEWLKKRGHVVKIIS